ncbi:hypothetical protein [Streptomyces sp. NRRL S-1022]|uniref:hypothetical protein n=1 Tax=Streptomyces sp. NRRL S-1022 TaxID=1463880 RepID=UPI00055C6DB4|nr:hypothetical protein [Streptomyces sp. NRRL S-1022]
MDALMAAITGDPLPEEARSDPAFLAEHRAAEADVAVLRDELARLAAALTGDEVPGEAGAPEAPAGAGEIRTPQDTSSAAPPARRPRGRTRPAGPPRPPRPGRPSGPRRALRVALGSLAGAAAFSLALGFGWLVTQGGGGADDNAGASAKGDAGRPEAASSVRPAAPERELACARLVVEGTVTKVERDEGASGSRVTLTVTRSYKPAHGPAEAGFLLAADARPAPRPGQHVLAGVGRGDRYATLWSVGTARVSADRAWITDALPASRSLPCPSPTAP